VEPVVIKTNHGWGYNAFIHDPASIDRTGIAVEFTRLLAARFGRDRGEWECISAWRVCTIVD
jgi:hypothetical protein